LEEEGGIKKKQGLEGGSKDQLEHELSVSSLSFQFLLSSLDY